MSSDSINIVLNLSPEGAILSFSVEESIKCEGLTEVKSDFADSCPKCNNRILVFTCQSPSQLKSEIVDAKEHFSGEIVEVKLENSTYYDKDDEMPFADIETNTEPIPKPTGDKWKRVAPIRCLHCNMVCRNATLLSKHQEHFKILGGPTEPAPDAVKCPDHCSRYFNDDEELQRHLKSVKLAYPRITYKCTHCSATYKDLTRFQIHIFKHGPAKCHKCELMLEDIESYNIHLKNVHGLNRAHQCTICSVRLDTEEGLKTHIRWVHEKQRSCSFCGKTFVKRQSLLEHENRHKKITPHQCHLCGASFSRQVDYKLHLRSHEQEGQGPYICDFCDKHLKSKNSLKMHMKALHVTVEELFDCPHCPKRFTHARFYKIHLRCHAEKNIPCPECDKKFTSKFLLRSHVKAVHVELSKRPKFDCETCGKVLLSKYSLKNHMDVHKTVTNFMCKYCKKSFSGKDHLRRHEMIHTDERPFTCQTCGKRFRHSDTLKVHTRLHTGEKPYECPVEECKKRFSDRGCFRSHLVVHEKNLNVKLIKKKIYFNE